MGEKTTRIDHTQDNADLERAVALIKKLQHLRRYIGTVQKTITDNILEVNVDALGLKSVRCYSTWQDKETYVVNAKIVVGVDETGICFILPPELPKGPGKTKVVQAIDDSSPATLDLDYVRFKASSLNPIFS